MIANGATTWWERWNGDTGDPAMNSYNHYAFGSVMAWVYRRVVGIDATTDHPGFQHILIAPQRTTLLHNASGEYESMYGRVATSWTDDGKVFTLNVTVPANTSATVTLPATAASLLYQDGRRVSPTTSTGVRSLQVGSGSYRFDVKEP